ncbi:hypothetical protein Trydic_g8267 [Trypoxylus dichotomus]
MTANIPQIFHSLESIINVFRRDEFNNLEPVKAVLSIYDKTLLECAKNQGGDGKKYPFIVFEGLDATGKTTISRRISKKHSATLLRTPSASLAHLRDFFNDSSLRVPFYSLGNYIAELEVLQALQQGPVILDRYWHSTAVYWLSQSIQDGLTESLPPKSDKIYDWPSDLLKPDMVIVLFTSEEIRHQRISRRGMLTQQEELLKSSADFRRNVIKAYENITEPKVEFVDSSGTINSVVGAVDGKIKHLFR